MLFGNIMGQLLSVLALSTKAMTGCRISELIGLIDHYAFSWLTEAQTGL